jgi:hypothetical protein
MRPSDYRHRILYYPVDPWALDSLSPCSVSTLEVYQRELNLTYSPLQLHTDDAAVSPVTDFPLETTQNILTPHLQVNRDLGVLRSKIGAEGLAAATECLPGEWETSKQRLYTLRPSLTRNNDLSFGRASAPGQSKSPEVKGYITMRSVITYAGRRLLTIDKSETPGSLPIHSNHPHLFGVLQGSRNTTPPPIRRRWTSGRRAGTRSGSSKLHSPNFSGPSTYLILG